MGEREIEKRRQEIDVILWTGKKEEKKLVSFGQSCHGNRRSGRRVMDAYYILWNWGNLKGKK